MVIPTFKTLHLILLEVYNNLGLRIVNLGLIQIREQIQTFSNKESINYNYYFNRYYSNHIKNYYFNNESKLDCLKDSSGFDTGNDCDKFHYRQHNERDCQYGASSYNQYNSEYTEYCDQCIQRNFQSLPSQPELPDQEIGDLQSQIQPLNLDNFNQNINFPDTIFYKTSTFSFLKKTSTQ